LVLASVKDVSSGSTLTQLCALRHDIDKAAPSPIVKFHAEPDAIVEEQVLLEVRSESYRGTEPVRGQAFWCSDAPKADPSTTRVIADINTCFVVTDKDPPAEILGIDPRGLQPGHGLSTGYALKLKILHPGVLHIVVDDVCRHMVLGRPVPASGIPSPMPWAELEVL
jgi:hypothetical protein